MSSVVRKEKERLVMVDGMGREMFMASKTNIVD